MLHFVIRTLISKMLKTLTDTVPGLSLPPNHLPLACVDLKCPQEVKSRLSENSAVPKDHTFCTRPPAPSLLLMLWLH